MQSRPVTSSLGAGERRFVVAFIASLVIIPLMFGELFPFSSAPMFRDRPKVYCVYEVTDPTGVALPLAAFALQRNYDGNPVGLGAGVPPPASLDVFGDAPSMERVQAHVRARLTDHPPALAYVDVTQTVIGAVDDAAVGVIRRQTARVTRDGD